MPHFRYAFYLGKFDLETQLQIKGKQGKLADN